MDIEISLRRACDLVSGGTVRVFRPAMPLVSLAAFCVLLAPNSAVADPTDLVTTANNFNGAGANNTVYGVDAGSYDTTGTDLNSAFGTSAGTSVVGDMNVALGASAGNNVGGISNIAAGSGAGNLVVGSYNVGVGSGAGSQVTGIDNTGVGQNSDQHVTGNNNTGSGQSSGKWVVGDHNAGSGLNSIFSVTGDDNTGAGQSSSSSITGSSNTGLGSFAGDTITGNSNTAAGLRAGDQVTGDNNIALGTNAGIGSGIPFSNAIAIGTSAAAAANTAIAIGLQAQATAPGSVAIGAGSVANEPNTVSVGSANAPRRITNVAPGIVYNDAATVGQLQGVQQQIGQNVVNANSGIAMALAESNLGGLQAAPGGVTVGVGTGYYQGQDAIGFGLSTLAKTQDRSLTVGAAISPGYGSVGFQAGYRLRVGHGKSKVETSVDEAKFDTLEKQTEQVIADDAELRAKLAAILAEDMKLREENRTLRARP